MSFLDKGIRSLSKILSGATARDIITSYFSSTFSTLSLIILTDNINFFFTRFKNWHFFLFDSIKVICIFFFWLDRINRQTKPGKPAPEPTSHTLILLLALFLKEIILLVSFAESLKCLIHILEIVPDPTRFVFSWYCIRRL